LDSGSLRRRGVRAEVMNFEAGKAASCVVGLIVVLGFANCNKRSGEAVVLEKEHIAVREPTPTPIVEPSASPTESTTEPTPDVRESTSSEEVVTELHEGEINADGYVMKKDVRGTGKDPRASDHEQWIVKVRMNADGRRFNVQTDQARWEKLAIGDHVEVAYREGKYTGTVWAAEIK